MVASDLSHTLQVMLQTSGLNQVKVLRRPRLPSDNGPSYVSRELSDWLEHNSISQPAVCVCGLILQFVLPRALQPDNFRFQGRGASAQVSGCRRVALSGRMELNVSRDAVDRGGAVVDMIVNRAGKAFYSVVSVATGAEVSLEPSANEVVEIEIGKYSNPDTDWFNVGIVLSGCN